MVFIWLGLVVALLLMSSEVSAVKDLAEKSRETHFKATKFYISVLAYCTECTNFL
ncbi:hypothetical protein MKW92_014384 [Papaver armeniacum]|nr:hypothetical protein MKW92_014384 [Papaver armeniacum]